MKTLNFNSRYALVSFRKAELENYDYTVEEANNDLEWLENEARNPIYNEGRKGATIVEKIEDGIVNYYTREYLQKDSIELLGYKDYVMNQIISDSEMSLHDQLIELEQMPENFVNSIFETSYDEMTDNQKKISVEKIRYELLDNADPVEIFKNFKDEIVEETLSLMHVALSGDRANRTFFFKIEENGDLTIDYLYYLGQQQLRDNCFLTIPDYETPDPEDFGFSSFEEMDFDACGYREFVENEIDQHIINLEAIRY